MKSLYINVVDAFLGPRVATLDCYVKYQGMYNSPIFHRRMLKQTGLAMWHGAAVQHPVHMPKSPDDDQLAANKVTIKIVQHNRLRGDEIVGTINISPRMVYFWLTGQRTKLELEQQGVRNVFEEGYHPVGIGHGVFEIRDLMFNESDELDFYNRVIPPAAEHERRESVHRDARTGAVKVVLRDNKVTSIPEAKRHRYRCSLRFLVLDPGMEPTLEQLEHLEGWSTRADLSILTPGERAAIPSLGIGATIKIAQASPAGAAPHGGNFSPPFGAGHHHNGWVSSEPLQPHHHRSNGNIQNNVAAVTVALPKRVLHPHKKPEPLPGDEKPSFVEKAHAVRGEFHRSGCFRFLSLVVFGLVAVLGAVLSSMELVKGFQQQQDNSWYITNPVADSRCVLFFETATKEVAPLSKYLVFNYNLANASVGVCTNASRTTIDGILGPTTFFDPIEDAVTKGAPNVHPNNGIQGACSTYNATALALAQANCGPQPDCASQLAPSPATGDFQLYHVLKGLEGGHVNSSQACAVSVESRRKPSETIPTCTDNFFVYKQQRVSIVLNIFLASFIFAWVRLGFELLGIIFYHCHCLFCCFTGVGCCCFKPCAQRRPEDGILYRVAFRGLFGPVHHLLRMFLRCSTHLPPVHSPPLILEILLVLGETIPNIVMPLYAISGCNINSTNFLLLLLLLFGIAKTAALFTFHIMNMLLDKCFTTEFIVNYRGDVVIRDSEVKK